jgi:hypothetical protein
MNAAEALNLALAVSTRSHPDLELLRQRGNDVIIARIPAQDPPTVIVKCWNRRGIRGSLRRLTRSNIGWREATALRRLEQLKTPAPRCLAYLELPHNAPHTEALISTDLGPCRDSTEFFKEHIKSDPEARTAFNQTLIEMTQHMIQKGLLDPDHRLPNIVITPDNQAMRIDFELCIPVRCPRLHPGLHGDMLGVFIGSYVFAVQPDLDLARVFARDLFKKLAPSPQVVRRAQHTLNKMVERQQTDTGIFSPLDLTPLMP